MVRLLTRSESKSQKQELTQSNMGLNLLKNKGKMSPEDRALIFRGIVNATKDHPEDGQKDKSGITKAIDQTEKMLNPFD